MKIFYKTRSESGRVHWYLFGIKIFSYKHKTNQYVIGKNNIVINDDKLPVNIDICGNNNKIIIGKSKYEETYNLRIHIGFLDSPCSNCVIKIGDNCSFSSTDLYVWDDGVEIEIGNDNMFSWGGHVFASDGHAITSLDGNIINIGKYIKIGNHVWVGEGVSILKNTIIPDNCIVGTRAIVSGKFTTQNAVLAGNPAKVVKTNINWD